MALSPRWGRVVFWVAWLVVWGLTTHAKPSADGDEPHYLMVTASLLADGDLDVQDNYARDDGARFGHDGLAPGPHARRDRTGVLRPVHDIGLPVLLVPVYALATGLAGVVPDAALARMNQSRGRFAYGVISVLLAALSAWAAVVVADTLVPIAGTPVAPLIALAIALTPPVLSNAFLVYPEVPALLVAALALRFAWRPRAPGWAEAVATMACIGVLVWLHRKFAPFAFALAGVIVLERWAWLRSLSSSRRSILATLCVAPALTLAAWTFATWGNLGGPMALEGVPLSPAGLGPGLAGTLVDRESGLVAWAPAALVLPLAWGLAWRRTWPLLLAAVALCVPGAAHGQWWGGWSPAGRFLVPLAPIAAVVLAEAWAHHRVRWLAAALLVPQAALALHAWQHPMVLWPQGGGANAALGSIPLWGPLVHWRLPSLRTSPASAAHAWMLIAAWLALVFALSRAFLPRVRPGD